MHHSHQSRSPFALLHLVNQQNKKTAVKILDIGFVGESNPTMHLALLKKMRASDKMTGVDIDAKNMEIFLSSSAYQAIQPKPQADYQVVSIFDSQLPKKNFDLVYLMEVIEHLPNPYAALDEVKTLIAPGGSLVITYPNPLNFPHFLKFIFKNNLLDQKFLAQFRGAPDHKIFPFPLCLVNYFNDGDFTVTDLQFIKFNLGKFSFLNPLLAKIGFLTRFSSYVGIVATKKIN